MYHCKYGISEILPESVSLYTLKRQSNSDATQYTHTLGDRHFLKGALPLNNHKSTKKVAIQMASIAKMYIFTAFGCARTPYAAVGRKKERQ